MSTMTETDMTTQLYQVWIKATPEAIWEAITQPEWTEKYGYPGHSEYELRVGGAYKAVAGKEMVAMGAPEIVIDGEVVETDPPRRLVQTWRFLWDPELVAEGRAEDAARDRQAARRLTRRGGGPARAGPPPLVRLRSRWPGA